MGKAGKLALFAGVVATTLATTTGAAGAETQSPQQKSQSHSSAPQTAQQKSSLRDQPAVWALPGTDLGPVLGATTDVPTLVLAPADRVLTAIGG